MLHTTPRPHPLLLTAALALAPWITACGDSTSGTDGTSEAGTQTTSASSNTSSDTDVSTSQGPTTQDTTSASDPSTGATSDVTSATEPSTTASTSDPSTSSTSVTTDPGTTTTTSTTSDSDTESGTTGDPPNADYYAFALAGGLDRIIIRKADYNAEQCIELRLVHPAIMGELAITTPEQWSVEGAAVYDTLTDCLVMAPLDGQPGWANGGDGSVTWPPDPNVLYPCEIDVDVNLTFMQDQPWIPAAGSLLVNDLAVEDCS